MVTISGYSLSRYCVGGLCGFVTDPPDMSSRFLAPMGDSFLSPLVAVFWWVLMCFVCFFAFD